MKSAFLFSLALLLLGTATSAPISLVGDVQAASRVNLHSHANIMVPVESRKRSLPESFDSVERRMLPGLGRKPKKAPAPVARQTVTIEIHNLPDAEINDFWNYFTTQSKTAIRKGLPNKGVDGAGLVKRDDIAAAFKECIPDRKRLLFWSAGDPKAKFLDGAIHPYAEKKGLSVIGKVSKSTECKANQLASIERLTLRHEVKKWKETKEADQHDKDYPKDKKNIKYTYEYKWQGSAAIDAYESVGRNHYWPVMSQAFADAAEEDVYYLRPDRKNGDPEDYPSGIWKNYEFPILKSNLLVKNIFEVTMPQLTTIASNPKMGITPGSERIRFSRNPTV